MVVNQTDCLVIEFVAACQFFKFELVLIPGISSMEPSEDLSAVWVTQHVQCFSEFVRLG